MPVSVQVERVFTFKHNGDIVELSDPNPEFSEEEVLNFYTTAYPALTTATIMPPSLNKDGFISCEFVSTVGTKG